MITGVILGSIWYHLGVIFGSLWETFHTFLPKHISVHAKTLSVRENLREAQQHIGCDHIGSLARGHVRGLGSSWGRLVFVLGSSCLRLGVVLGVVLGLS